MVSPEDHAAGLQWREIRPPGRLAGRLRLAELWRRRELALVLAGRDLRLRYRQTLFGVAWAALQPLAAMAVFSLTLGEFAGVPSNGLPYPLFVLAALAVWAPLSGGVAAAAETFVEHRELVSKVAFPRMLAPLGAVLAFGLDLAIALGLVAIAMVAYGVAPGLAVLTLPLWLAGGMVVAVGAGLWLSAANVLYRDVRYALGFLLQVWLFATPIVYPISVVDDGWRWVVALNPLAGVVEGVRWALLDGPAPGGWIAVSAAAAVALLVSGALYFRSAERTFADRI